MPHWSRWTLLRAVVVVAAVPGSCLLAEAVEANPSQAHAVAGEEGQAVLVSRLDACYAVTPAHVLGDEKYAALQGAPAGASLGDADLLQAFGYDLSILRVSGELAKDCGEPLSAIFALEDVLAARNRAVVSSVNRDGSVSRRAVTIVDVDVLYLRVRPISEADDLFQGLSGSPVIVGDRVVGLLMSIDAETGEGKVLRFDRAAETLRPFFSQAPGPIARDVRPPRSSLELRVVSWSAPPLSAETRATNLTVSGRTWFAVAGEFPVELTLELPGGEAHTIDRVRLVGEGIELPERLLRDFEILVSATDTSGWVSLGSGTYFQGDTEKIVRFSPVRGRRILLRIYSNWGDAQAVGFSAIEVPVAQ